MRNVLGLSGLAALVLSSAACGGAPTSSLEGTPAGVSPPSGGDPQAVSDGGAPGSDAAAPGPEADAAAGPAVDGASSSLDWNPGHYVLLGNASQRDAMLASADMAPFTGLQIKYDWATFEGAQGDYAAGFAAIDADLAAVAAKGKKLIVMLMYKEFGGLQAVPAYMTQPGPWCVTPPSAGSVCGQYAMANGLSAMFWQGKGTGGVSDRLHAWFAALGAHVASNAHGDALAGIVLPETAISQGAVPLADVGYTQPVYLVAIEDDATALVQAFPTKPINQYINFFPPNATAAQYLTSLADWAVAHPHVGLGCPDVGPLFSPPGYAILKDTKYQARLPFNVAIEAPDYGSARTASLQSTYDLAVSAGPNGLRAQTVAWFNAGASAGNVFSLADVSAYIAQHPMPNTAPPTW